MRSALLLVLLMLLAACAPVQMKGVNLLQSRNIALNDLRTVENLQHLRALGANTLALVAFFRQSGPQSCDLKLDSEYAEDRMRRSILIAHSAGLKIVLKPQILVEGSWAGEIDPVSEAGWKCWFEAYRGLMLDYARFASQTRVEMLVVGTELSKTELRPEWLPLLQELRQNYAGELSYVGQSLSGAQRFIGLAQLDSVAISFYPGMEKPAGKPEMLAWMQELADKMKDEVKLLGKPFWIAEVGITSRVGALKDPWLWPESLPQPRVPDLALQAEVLDGWLTVLRGDWHKGILVWNWYSDPKAGGAEDIDFTIQNKPAQQSVSCHWLGICK